MIPAGASLLDLSSVLKHYGALRPLRVARLEVASDDRLAILGLDQPAAEVFINLATGASLPDSGDILIDGRPTRALTNSSEWFDVLDRFGIVSARASFLENMSILQNLALPFSLEIEPPAPDLLVRAASLASEVGLEQRLWERPVGTLDATSRVVLRVARALAQEPAVLLLEHPSVDVPRAEIAGLARRIRDIVTVRRIAMVALTMDREFADAAADRVLTLEPATGKLLDRQSGRIRFWS